MSQDKLTGPMIPVRLKSNMKKFSFPHSALIDKVFYVRRYNPKGPYKSLTNDHYSVIKCAENDPFLPGYSTYNRNALAIPIKYCEIVRFTNESSLINMKQEVLND